MTAPRAALAREERLRLMFEAASEEEQRALRASPDESGYYQDISRACLSNPFFRLTDAEFDLFRKAPNASALRTLIVARETAARTVAPRHAVFCMPKSGSSFIQSALQHALELPVVSLTSFGVPGLSSFFGMNSREQEIDEMGLVKSILDHRDGFVAQHHTRCSVYLARQLKLFGIAPILTIRNILDCIVSFDDMMLAWRRDTGVRDWFSDAQFALPINYVDLPAEARYAILARSFGTWLVAFHLSWARCRSHGFVNPLVLRYEEDILDPDRLARRISDGLGFTTAQRARLVDYIANPDKVRSRFNVGVKGRGRDRIPADIRAELADYTRAFADEIPADDLAYLIE
jgi:hypothetical protein